MSDGVAAADPSDVPFPVEAPFRMRADLVRLDESDASLFERCSNDDAMRAAKRRAQSERASAIGVPDPQRTDVDIARDVAATLPCIAELRPDVVHAGPSRSAFSAEDPGGRVWSFPLLEPDDPLLASAPDADRARPAWASLADALALSLPEDFAWMRDAAGEPAGVREGRASLLHVTFPSHWAPERRAGATLADLHGPVADGDALRAASPALIRAMVSKGPFRRHVWSLTTTPELDRHPLRASNPSATTGSPEPSAIHTSWFRVEVQTSLPFPSAGIALFAIRVHVTPLRDVLTLDPARARLLAASIRSMTPEVRRYKGLAPVGDRLVAELDAWE